MNLIIVESPTKSKTLLRFLGSQYTVYATKGHIKDLPKSKLSIDIDNNFEPHYQWMDSKKNEIQAIKKAAKKASQIYIATDPDREGEAIASHVKEIVDQEKKISKRILFHEITKSAVEEAIKKPQEVNNNLVNAQTARRVLDRLVGYKLSPLLWKKVRRNLSAGRVQSVAVRLIVEREKEIEDFKPIEYWEISALLKIKKQNSGIKEFMVRLIKVGNKKAEVKNADTARKIVSELEKSDYLVYDVKSKEVRKKPYAPFTTSTMTQAAARLFGWSAKKTMSIAQRLYEEGLITYHRTDSTNISITALGAAKDFIQKEYGKDYHTGDFRLYKTKSKSAQEAHEAIRPTDLNLKSQKLNDNLEKKLYDLIWRRFVASQMSDAIYDETIIDVLAQFKDSEKGVIDYLLRASGQVMKFDGWRKLFPTKPNKDLLKESEFLVGKDESSVEEYQLELPKLDKGDLLSLIKVLADQKFTQPPPRYNEASLIKTLEKLGIGRPSTYAPIITTIQLRGYVEKDQGKFKPTAVGIAVNEFLVSNFPDELEYSFTAKMEQSLDDIADGKLEWHQMMRTFWQGFSKKLAEVEEKSERVKIAIEKVGKNCPLCEKGDLVIRTGRFGKFISCSNFPDCKYTEKIVNKIDIKCPKCGEGDIVIRKTKKGRKFFGCSKYPECDFASWQKPQLKSEDNSQITE